MAADSKVVQRQVTAKLVLWNNTDGQGDHGADQVKVELIKSSATIWSKTVEMAWKEGEETKTEVEVPWGAVDTIKIAVTRPHKADAALAEVELLVDGQNILKSKKVTASSEWDTTGHSTSADKVTDGDKNGGWRARGKAGWVEIDVK